LIEQMAMELDIDIIGVGSATWSRKDIKKGLEPDECYYIKSFSQVFGKQIDLSRDPPPDLALEIDISRSSLSRQAIYAALGVPELWRFGDEHLQFFALQPNGKYSRVECSVNFPFLECKQVERYVKMRGSVPDNSIVRQFLKYARRAKAKHNRE